MKLLITGNQTNFLFETRQLVKENITASEYVNNTLPKDIVEEMGFENPMVTFSEMSLITEPKESFIETANDKPIYTMEIVFFYVENPKRKVVMHLLIQNI